MAKNPVVDEPIVEKVRARYAQIAEGKLDGSCGALSPCCGGAEGAVALGVGYDQSALGALPKGANMGLGCGAPVEFLDLRPGETVLDLGSGGGIDALLAARLVGESGRVIGVDMTPEMIARARENAQEANLGFVEFREGRLEALPVADSSVDAVTSNCVINLVPDKAAVFREVSRVLKTGGRMVVSDIVLDGPLPDALAQDILAWVGCVAGAIQRQDYFAMVETAGLGSIEVLKDVDYLGGLAKMAPEEAEGILARAGTTLAEVLGKVRSITYRAQKGQ